MNSRDAFTLNKIAKRRNVLYCWQVEKRHCLTAKGGMRKPSVMFRKSSFKDMEPTK